LISSGVGQDLIFKLLDVAPTRPPFSLPTRGLPRLSHLTHQPFRSSAAPEKKSGSSKLEGN